ncbi:urease accessory protein UreF [Limosilactobacillus equigenerosi]|uniref:Urease accessory protein UreF n=1 Tax=Limosilactobacillus equigenerosi DSM 18793 = JCM 14505 TaxID=1423742 RepID=A0A0R1UI23_9LACO|nr:urease accessory protein UreF [Limosilactobacillus equigenerosi]KRL93020.1 Urease accessory protein UreF [Limosilactobacillus equigenerosi DSM 18793 = JCM 14505]
MENKLETRLRNLAVFQICDSTFPIGTFNHSFGMENYLRNGLIDDANQFSEWLTNYYQSQFKYGEGLLTLLVYQALDCDNFNQLQYLDDVITKSTLARETRDGTKVIAKQMVILIQKIYGNQIKDLNQYAELMEHGKVYGNPAIVFAIFAHYQGVSKQDAYLMYGYSVASTLVQNAVRAIPLGQREGQVVLNRIIKQLGDLYQESCQYDVSYLGANTPGLELAQINHETQNARLFMS